MAVNKGRERLVGERRLAVAKQLLWMAERGDSVAGYVRFYGSVNEADHVGDGGEAIYEADRQRLQGLQRALEAALGG